MTSKPKWNETDLPRPTGLDPSTTARTLRVAPELAGMRLDVFIKLTLRHTSRNRARLIATAGAYSTTGKKLKHNRRVKAEQLIVLWRNPVDEVDETLELPIVYEDQDLLVINKPAGLTVHPTASHYHRTVTRMLEANRPGQHISLIHRLDRDTSGVLLVALNPAADRAFKMLLEGTLRIPKGVDASLRKTYQAVTWNVPPDGLIDLPITRDEHNPLRVKMKIAPLGEGQPSQTQIRVQETCDSYALVQCRLLTGRQHQIRLHLSSQGSPIVGDKLYGPDETLHARGADNILTDEDVRLLELPRQALHAWRYELPNPLTWQRLDLQARLPDDMSAFWRKVAGSEPLPPDFDRGNPTQH